LNKCLISLGLQNYKQNSGEKLRKLVFMCDFLYFRISRRIEALVEALTIKIAGLSWKSPALKEATEAITFGLSA
jgi:hypothetical protein